MASPAHRRGVCMLSIYTEICAARKSRERANAGQGHGHIQRGWQSTDEEILHWFIRVLRQGAYAGPNGRRHGGLARTLAEGMGGLD